jgi:nicotinamide-nucleotide amidase
MATKNINAEIITIGDEILIGQIVDTNSAWLAKNLNKIGINVAQMTSISDNNQHIINALNDATLRADLIIVTGGLGPTKDDITKNTAAEYFNSKLVLNNDVLDHIKKLLTPKAIDINHLNISQAEVPDNCLLLHNEQGTAPGMWFEKNQKIFVFLPGVPYEMEYIYNTHLKTSFQKYFNTPAIVHKTLMLIGVAESMLEPCIHDWEEQLPEPIKLAYLPSPGLMKLRLTAKGDAEENLNVLIDNEVKKVLPLISKWFYTDDDENIEVTIGKLLRNNKKTMCTCESCTGGNIAHLLTSIAGSSDYFKGSIVSYANEIKENLVHVAPRLIENFGAVSKSVVEAMAENTLKLMNADYAVATSGIAGPDGGTVEKPVGTIWIAVCSKNKIISRKLNTGDSNRERNIRRATLSVLKELHELILSEINDK